MQTIDDLILEVHKRKTNIYKKTPILELTPFEWIVVVQNSLLNDNIGLARQWLAYAFLANVANNDIKDFVLLMNKNIEENRIQDVIDEIEYLNEQMAKRQGMDRLTYENIAYTLYGEAVKKTKEIVAKRNKAGFFKKVINKFF